VLDHEYDQLRALKRPTNRLAEIGQFLTARGRERTQMALAAWQARRRSDARSTTPPIVMTGTSASLAGRLGLTECAKRGGHDNNESGK
jgi:hypothetical protein